jgi:cation diffusion facilitator CzcD-associated flavoprotein CzcO
MGSVQQPSGATDLDVLIVGAGISGINAAYRVKEAFPNINYAILEARGSIGGTWDLFKYPGIRSDSDLHTFGFAWRPWQENRAIVDGPSIVSYMKESAAQYGIDKRIIFHTKVLESNWVSSEQKWHVYTESPSGPVEYTAKFVILGTGYYNYDSPLEAKINGIENFEGKIVHPQFWPKDLDWTNKNVVVIGSGATAITILPAMGEKAAHVTMLQRSPTYIMARPNSDPLDKVIRAVLPQSWADSVVRWKWLLVPQIFFQFCRLLPSVAKKVLVRLARKQLPLGTTIDPDWTPQYNPWEQRLCISPDADFYEAIRSGKCSVVTGHIDTVTEKSIKLKDGRELHPDIIVTATGLRLLIGGGAKLTIDGKPFDLHEKYLWKGQMLEGVPNAAFAIGYTNASWTLGADATAKYVCRIIKHMQDSGAGAVVPRLTSDVRSTLNRDPPFNLKSTYLLKALDQLPLSGGKGVWQSRGNCLTDLVDTRFGTVTEGLEYVPGKVWGLGQNRHLQ